MLIGQVAEVTLWAALVGVPVGSLFMRWAAEAAPVIRRQGGPLRPWPQEVRPDEQRPDP